MSTAVTSTLATARAIHDHRKELFGIEASLTVARNSLSPDDNYPMWRVLSDVIDRIDKLSAVMELTAMDIPAVVAQENHADAA